MTGYMIAFVEPTRHWPEGCWNVYRISTAEQHFYLGTVETLAQVTDAMAIDHATRPQRAKTV